MAFECKRIRAMSLLTIVCVCILCVRLTRGECRDATCPCVPQQLDVENRCCIYISENLPPGSLIGNANDLDLISTANPVPQTYQLVSDRQLPGMLFEVNITTGAITTAAQIDRENITMSLNSEVQGDCISFQIDARSSTGQSVSGFAAFGVVIMDENDNYPRFNRNATVLNITVFENEGPNTLNCQNINELTTLLATDSDSGENGTVTYEVAEGYGNNIFSVTNPENPCVNNLVAMDRENPDNLSYSFVLLAKDGGSPALTSNITVIFTLLDINDNPPIFVNVTMMPVNVNVREDASIGEVIRRFQATDKDNETQLRYDLGVTTAPFEINHTTGEVSLTNTLDAETRFSPYSIVVLANDNNSVHTTELQVDITVIDVNEPVTIRQNIPSEILEGAMISNFQLQIEDFDTNMSNRINTFRFVSGGEYFRSANTIPPGFVIFFNIEQFTPIDRENVTNSNVRLEIIVNQSGDPQLETTFVHNFTILDINDNEPYLTQWQFNQTEVDRDTVTIPPSIQLKDFVKDDDEGENGTVVSFILTDARDSSNGDIIPAFKTSNGFAVSDTELNINNGNLNLPVPLDREELGEVLTITMNFTDGGSPPLSKTESFQIRIIDINDNSPIFVKEEYSFDLTENLNPGTSIGSVMANDKDDVTVGNGVVEYYLDETRGDYINFTVDPREGIVRNKVMFDREVRDRYTIYVGARDRGSPPNVASVPAMVTINIIDLNDEPPIFTMDSYTFEVISGANVGDFVDNVEAVDHDLNPTENQVVYNFVYSTPNFLIENNTGRITLARVLSIQDSPYNLTVVAYNPGSVQLNSTAAVTVRVSTTNQLGTTITASISGGVAFLVLVAILIVCCCICCLCHKSRTTGKHEVDGNGSQLNNKKPILKNFTATNGQQSLRSVKFSTTVEETHYDPSGIEHSVIRKESNLGSGDESPQTSLRANMPNGAMNMNGQDHDEIIDYDMSPSLVLNGDISHRPPYSRHGRAPSPIMLHEELNPSEFSQSTSSVMDDRNTYNSEGEEAESTFSDAPSNFNISIPRFGRQTIQVEDHHHPSDLAHFVTPTSSHTPLDIHAHLPHVHHMHGQHSSPNHLAELRAHNLAAYDAQFASTSHHPPPPVGVPPADDIRDMSLSSLPRNIGHHHHHHHHGSITSSHSSTPPTRHIPRQLPPPGMHQQPPVSMSHSIVTPPSNGHTNTRNYPHPLVMPDAFPPRIVSTDVHRFDSFIPSFGDYGETSTYASTELNEALEFKYEAEPDFCSLTATDYDENDTEL